MEKFKRVYSKKLDRIFVVLGIEKNPFTGEEFVRLSQDGLEIEYVVSNNEFIDEFIILENKFIKAKCFEDVIMEDGSLAYKDGKTYFFNYNGIKYFGFDEIDNNPHSWTPEEFEEYFEIESEIDIEEAQNY